MIYKSTLHDVLKRLDEHEELIRALVAKVRRLERELGIK